jgi:hypothetical protein
MLSANTSTGDGGYSVHDDVENMRIYNSRIGIDINCTGTGYVTTCDFRNIDIHAAIYGIRTREPSSTVPAIGSINFDNVMIQHESGTLFGIDSLEGDNMNFDHLVLWDFAAGSVSCVLSANTNEANMNGMGIDAIGYSDLGKGNRVISWKQKMQGVWFKDENKESGSKKVKLTEIQKYLLENDLPYIEGLQKMFTTTQLGVFGRMNRYIAFCQSKGVNEADIDKYKEGFGKWYDLNKNNF